MRVYLLLPLYHEFVNSKHYKTLHIPFAQAIFKLTENPRKVLEKWWAQTPSEYFEQMVINFLHVAMHIISFKMGIEVINHNEPRQKKVIACNHLPILFIYLLINAKYVS